MKLKFYFLALLSFLFLTPINAEAQFGRNTNNYGRRTNNGPSTIPRGPSGTKEKEPQTAEQLVDDQMPNIIETLGLDPFEQAVVRTSLVSFAQKVIEMQILKLEPETLQEEFKRLKKIRNEELKAGLPTEKYESFVELSENNFRPVKKKKRKKKNKT